MSFFANIALLMTGALLVHAFFAPAEIDADAVPPTKKPPPTKTPKTDSTRSAMTLRRLGVIVLVAIGFWISLSAVVPVLVWGLWIGDNEHWFWHAWPYITALLALIATAPLIYRALATNVGRRFFSIQAFYAATVNGLWAAYCIATLVEPIKGMDPLSAAQAVVREYGHDPSEFTFVPTAESVHFPNDPANYRTFIVMGPDEPRARITVHRHLNYSWKQVAVSWFPPSAQSIARAKEAHKKGGSESSVRAIIQQILQNYPDTPAAKEAEQLLREVDAEAARRKP